MINTETLRALVDAGNRLDSAMDMQEQRERGTFHLSQQAAAGVWKDARRLWVEAVEQALSATDGVSVFTNDGNEEQRFIEHESLSCPHCGGSGHRDDVAAAQVADEGALEHWDSILSDAEEISSNSQDDRIKYRADRVVTYLRSHKPAAAPAVVVDEATVERAAFAVERSRHPEWTDGQFDTWWYRDPFFCERLNAWSGFWGTRKQKALHEARIALTAALDREDVRS